MSYSTRQREVILNVLRQAGRPLTPQDIREQASQDSAGIGLATVTLDANGHRVASSAPADPRRGHRR